MNSTNFIRCIYMYIFFYTKFGVYWKATQPVVSSGTVLNPFKVSDIRILFEETTSGTMNKIAFKQSCIRRQLHTL